MRAVSNPSSTIESTTASITARGSMVLMLRAAAATVETSDHRRSDSSCASSNAPICCLTSLARKLAKRASNVSIANDSRTAADSECVPVAHSTVM